MAPASTMMLIVAAAALGMVVVDAQTPPFNPQQQKCAQPPKGCPSQKKMQSCINWHGCMWVSGMCYYDETCETTKATVVPTRAPVPTVPTIPRPTTKKPTPAPTKCTLVPPDGNCFSMKTEQSCSEFKCCMWNSVARPQRCQYQDLPTSAPTPPTVPAPTMPVVCKNIRTRMDCLEESTCTWCRKCRKNKCRAKMG